tara:strand:- start:682 stop:870 length:189 start_codon:yes stop_codon:yes gene_type:complete
MDELIQYLEQSVENVRGVDMVPLSVAIQAVQTASSMNLLESVEQMTADLMQSINQYGSQNEQ